jgi:hypothetical protein
MDHASRCLILPIVLRWEGSASKVKFFETMAKPARKKNGGPIAAETSCTINGARKVAATISSNSRATDVSNCDFHTCPV